MFNKIRVLYEKTGSDFRSLLCRLAGLYLLCVAASVPLPLICIVLLLGTLALGFLRNAVQNAHSDSLVLLAGFLSFGCRALWKSGNIALYAGITLFTVMCGIFLLRTDDFKSLRTIPAKTTTILLALIPLLSAVIISVLCICQHYTYRTSCFDLGIFAQMFHSMKTDLTQTTTCERNTVLSHFSVHISPIYYLLLPLYTLFPAVETLLISQAFLVMSGAIPLMLLCRHLKFGNLSCINCTVIYCCCAGLVSPCFYDFHENAFLPPLLLWSIFAAERNIHPLAIASGTLILLVKEDAALYLFCIGLYYLCTKGRRITGGIACLSAGIYFLISTTILSSIGEGAMVYRTYSALMTNPEGGILNVIHTVLTHPARFFAVCFAEEKLPFLLSMLLPFLFLPLLAKKPQRLFLCLPFVLINLASSYLYTAHISYQYVFGTSACLIAAAVLNVADFSPKRRHPLLCAMALSSFFCLICLDSGKLELAAQYTKNRTHYQQIAAVLDNIPPDASVCSNTQYLPHLAERTSLFCLDTKNWDTFDCDIVIIHPGDSDADRQISLLLSEGYLYSDGVDPHIAVYTHPDHIA